MNEPFAGSTTESGADPTAPAVTQGARRFRRSAPATGLSMPDAPRATPVFSLLVSAYRTEAFVADTIGSVLAQTMPDWELIVVDNGNSDEMAGIVRGFQGDDRVVLIRQENRGISGGRNAAAAAARGRYFVCLDSDDRLLPTYLEEMAAALDADPTLGAVSCDAQVHLESVGTLATRNLLSYAGKVTPDLSDRDRHLELLLRENFLYAGGTIRREAFEAVGGFSDRVPGVEDWDMWLRLVAAGWGIAVIEKPLAIYRIRDDSTSRGSDRVERFESSVIRTLELAIEEMNLTPDERGAAEHGLRSNREMFARRRARVSLAEGDYPEALAHARAAHALRPRARTAAVVLGLRIAPGLLRGVQRARAKSERRLTRAILTHLHRRRGDA